MAKFGEDEWFFFSPRDRNGSRPNRAAASGFWKATGTNKPILTSTGSQCIGVKKALVFCQGRPPKGSKTNWMMYEYRLLNRSYQTPGLTGSMRLDDSVLCRVYQKSETTPKQCHKSSSSTLSRYVLKGSERKNIMENTSYSKHYRIAPKEINNQLRSAQLLSQFLVEPKEVTSNEIADDIGFVDDFLEENEECYMSEAITEPQIRHAGVFHDRHTCNY